MVDEIGNFDLPADVGELLVDRSGELADGTLVLLPARIGSDGVGRYRAEQLTMPKEWRRFGVETVFLHEEPHQRTGLSEFAAADVVYGIVLGVIGNMTYDVGKAAVSYLFHRVRAMGAGTGPQQLRVHIGKVERTDGTTLKDVDLVGPPDAGLATEVLRVLTGDPGAAGIDPFDS